MFFNEQAASYNDLLHKKMREYVEDNFEISLIETLYTENINEVNTREVYQIKEKQSYCGTGLGYNIDLGCGRKAYSSKLSQEELQEVKGKIKQGVPYYDIESQYNTSSAFISSINHGIYFKDDNEEYPLYKYYKDKEDYDELIDLLVNSEYSLKKISEILNMGYSTVKKINAGTLRKGLYPTYPIRKKTANEMRADKIKNLLLTTEKTNKEIAYMVNSSEETVRRIKIGEYFRDEKLSYPLSNL